MTARARSVPNWIYVLFVLFFIALCTRLLVQLPPASEASHAFAKHGWDALRSYMNVAASNPNDFKDGDSDELSGRHICTDGSTILDVVFDGELYNIVFSSVDATKLHTAYVSDNHSHVERKVRRCLGQ